MGNICIFSLGRPVCIKEGTGNIDDFIAPPGHHKTPRIIHIGNDCRFQIFFRRIGNKTIGVFFPDNHRHPFLRFGNRQFRTVKAFIFLRHAVQVDGKTVCQFSYRHGYAARAKVIAPLDQTGHFAAAEKALDFSLRQRIAFLHFCATGFDGFRIQFFRRSCRAAHAVTACPSAHEDDHITGFWSFTNDMAFRSPCYNSADFHAFCHESGVIILFHFSCSETDLVPVRAIPFCRFHNDFLLR